MSDYLSAIVTVRFRVNSVASQQDLDDLDMTLDEMVRHLCEEDGLFGIVQDEYEIVSVEAADEEDCT